MDTDDTDAPPPLGILLAAGFYITNDNLDFEPAAPSLHQSRQ